MSQAVPTPVAAVVGLAPAALDVVCRLPGRAAQLPVLAIGSALTGLDAARREYEDLAVRGERLIGRLRGASFDEFEDRVEDALQGTPLAGPYDAVEDTLEDAAEAVAGTVSRLATRTSQRTERAADTAEQTARKAADTLDETARKVEHAADQAATKAETAAERAAAKAAEGTGEEPPAAEQPKGGPTPAETQPDATRVDTAATADTVQTVEQASAEVAAPVLDHDELPLADYDHMTLGSLRGRLRSLDVDQLVQIRDYEKAHADRLPVVTMLDNRIAKLAAAGADEQPSGVPSDRPAPGQGDTPSGSRVTPATGGPAQNPPSAGVPTNPSQPRTTGSPGTNPSSNA